MSKPILPPLAFDLRLGQCLRLTGNIDHYAINQHQEFPSP